MTETSKLTIERRHLLTILLTLTSTILIAVATFFVLNLTHKSYVEGYVRGQEDILREIEAQILKTDHYILETENLIYTLEQIDNATITKP